MVATSLPSVGIILGRRTHESHVKPCPAGLFLLGTSNGCSKCGSHKLILLIEDRVFSFQSCHCIYIQLSICTYIYIYCIYVNNLNDGAKITFL